MIEITLTEMVLFAWSILATAAAIKYKDEARAIKRMLVMFLENMEALDQLLKAHEQFVKEQS
jgi:hypothetical protein